MCVSQMRPGQSVVYNGQIFEVIAYPEYKDGKMTIDVLSERHIHTKLIQLIGDKHGTSNYRSRQ